jgi:hypothetical protein
LLTSARYWTIYSLSIFWLSSKAACHLWISRWELIWSNEWWNYPWEEETCAYL